MALSVSEKLAASLHDYQRTVQDNATLSNALTARLRSRGKIKTFGGGVDLREKVYYQVGQNARGIGEWEQFPIDPWNHLTDAVFDRKLMVSSFIISGQEMLDNREPAQIVDLAESRLEACKDALVQKLAVSVYGDGTGDDGKVFDGLKSYVPDSPATGTVGGIPAADYSWWRSIAYDSTTDGGGALSSTNVQAQIIATVVQITRGADRPDLGVADNLAWQYLYQSMTSIARITDTESDVAKLNFQSLKFMGMDFVLDGGYGQTTSGVASVSTKRIYLLNTKYIGLRVHKDMNFAVIAPDKRSPVDQFGYASAYGVYGNLTVSNRFLQAVIKD
jgi:hypothetical protein